MSTREDIDGNAEDEPYLDDVERVIAECLELPEERWEEALSRACDSRPELSSRIRRRFGLLVKAGVAESSSAVLKVDAELPDRLGEFRLLGRQGGGGMGLVFLAEQESTGRRVALKIARPDQLLLPHTRERFRREVETIATLDHPSIVKIVAVGEDTGIPWFAMEHVDGATLAEVLREVRGKDPDRLRGQDLLRIIRTHSSSAEDAAAAPADELFGGSWTRAIVRIMLEVANALQHAHDCGILHRDLKPSNVLVGGDGRVLLIDFGLALGKSSSPLTQTGVQVGSLPYLSPEQIRLPSRGDVSTDVYSFGVSLYELLTLRSPFLDGDSERTRQRILAADPEPVRRLNPGVSIDLATLVEVAMERDPLRRYPTAAALAEDLARVVHGRKVVARRPSGWTRTRRFIERHPVGMSAALLVMAQVITAQAWLGLQWKSGRRHSEETLQKTQSALEQAMIARNDAETAKESAEQILEQTKKLLDQQSLRVLPAEADELFPLTEQVLPGIEIWLKRAEEQIARKPVLDKRLLHLEAALRALDPSAAQSETLRAEIEAVRRELRSIERLERKKSQVLEQRRVAEGMRERSIDGEEAAAAWKAAVEEIFLSEIYGGLEVEPQLGLVPLGPDPVSGLFEFWHVQSGERPEPNEDPSLPSRWKIKPETGMVLVLVPGQRFMLGARQPNGDRKSGPNIDPMAARYEGPPQEIDLDPFFISKYEATLGQWFRHADVEMGFPMSDTRGLAFPTGFIDHQEAVQWAERNGLSLPTEAQWECAARGGTRSVYFTGDEFESLEGCVNLCGRERARLSDAVVIEDYRDAFVDDAPVCTLRPNPYGLFHVIGNVAEWCLDGFLPYEALGTKVEVRDGDGLRFSDLPVMSAVLRGGSFMSTALQARSAARADHWIMVRTLSIGLRPARMLER